MKEKLLEFIKEIQSDERFDTFDEPAIKQGIVLKILSFLDWDPFNVDEIQPEYEVDHGKVDFALKQKNSSRVFIIVKKGVKALKKHQESLLTSAAKEDVKVAILTDGITWWFYLSDLEANIEDKRFDTIDMNELKPSEIAQKFNDFLSKENIISGKAVKAAKNIYHARLKEQLIKKNLPKAWKKMMSEPEKWLFDILAGITEEMCGQKPDRETVEKFIALEIDANAEISDILAPKAPSAPPPSEHKDTIKPAKPVKPDKPAIKDEYTGKSIAAFTLKGTKYEVKSWKAMLLKLCEILFESHKDDFEMVLTLSSRNKDNFTTNPYELLNSEKIKGTEIYVDIDLNAMGIVSLSHRMLGLFGYKESDLKVDTK